MNCGRKDKWQEGRLKKTRAPTAFKPRYKCTNHKVTAPPIQKHTGTYRNLTCRLSYHIHFRIGVPHVANNATILHSIHLFSCDNMFVSWCYKNNIKILTCNKLLLEQK